MGGPLIWGDWVGFAIVLGAVVLVVHDYRKGYLRLPFGLTWKGPRYLQGLRSATSWEQLGFQPTKWQRYWWTFRVIVWPGSIVVDRVGRRIYPRFLIRYAGHP